MAFATAKAMECLSLVGCSTSEKGAAEGFSFGNGRVLRDEESLPRIYIE
jgi:hypothetical protein